MVAEFTIVPGAEVRQFMLLPMAPQILHRIQFRGVSRKKFKFQTPIGGDNEVFHHSTTMRPQSIPDHNQIPVDVAQEMFQELHRLRTADGPWKEPEVESPPSDVCNSRKRLPIEVILKYWSLPSGCPSTIAMRPFAQPAFVDENYCATLPLGFFLTFGHRSFFHRRIFSSSRSSARPVGRWQLQPSLRNSHHTCPGLYLTPHSRSIRSATRQAVQRLVSYPSASGPRLRPASILPRSASVSLGFRPARPAFFKPVIPCSANCRAHRFTDCRCTPTRLATSASWTPFSKAAQPAADAFPMHQSPVLLQLDFPCTGL